MFYDYEKTRNYVPSNMYILSIPRKLAPTKLNDSTVLVLPYIKADQKVMNISSPYYLLPVLNWFTRFIHVYRSGE